MASPYGTWKRPQLKAGPSQNQSGSLAGPISQTALPLGWTEEKGQRPQFPAHVRTAPPSCKAVLDEVSYSLRGASEATLDWAASQPPLVPEISLPALRPEAMRKCQEGQSVKCVAAAGLRQESSARQRRQSACRKDSGWSPVPAGMRTGPRAKTSTKNPNPPRTHPPPIRVAA